MSMIYNDPTDPMGYNEPDHFAFEDIDKPTEFESYRSMHNIRKNRPAGNSCPRCFSKRIKVEPPHIICNTCKLTEPLMDFPMSRTFSALEQPHQLELLKVILAKL